MTASDSANLGFTHETVRAGEVRILRHGRLVTMLRDKAAADFLAALEGASLEQAQQVMARATGNYKRGNEQQAGKHPRNQ